MNSNLSMANINRFPRPLGVTAAMGEYHKTEDQVVLEQVRSQLIQLWLLRSGIIFGKTMNIYQLAEFLKCDPARIQSQMGQVMFNNNLYDRNNQNQLVENLIGQSVAWVLEDRMDVEQQVGILRESQGGKYVPFVSSELNKALGLKQSSTSALQQLVGKFTGGGTINIFAQQNNTQNNSGVDIATAIEIIQKEQLAITTTPQEVIEVGYEDLLEGLPEVVATKQIGINTDKEGLNINKQELNQATDDYKGALAEIDETHHSFRREMELRIDQDAEDPEITHYQLP